MMEYENMKKNLDIILDNIVILAEQIGFKEEIDKFTLMDFLISNGYLLKDRNFTFNKDIPCRDLQDDVIFQFGIVPITGEGCCRHISSLAKLILDRFDIKNEIAAAVSLECLKENNKDIASLLNESEMIKQESYCNHAFNIVKIGNKDIAINLFPGVSSILYSINQNVAVEFFEDVDSENNYLVYNYSPFFEGRKDFDRIKPLSIEEQKDTFREVINTILVVQANRDLLEKFYANNRPYMEDIDNNYKKILVKEREL